MARDENPPFTSVRVWEWNEDSEGRSGGQEALVTPYLVEAHFAVFVFKERVGMQTWKELNKCRELKEDRPPIATVFPVASPLPDRMVQLKVAEEWVDLLRRKQELGERWGEAGNIAIRPLPDYKDHSTLSEIVLDQFKRDLDGIITRAMARGSKSDHRSFGLKVQLDKIYEGSNQLHFDRRFKSSYSVSDLDQSALMTLLQQPTVLQKLNEAGLNRAPIIDKLAHLGLASGEMVTMGLFLCYAPRDDIVNKYLSCSLKLVVYSETRRATSNILYSDAPCGNLLFLYDKGIEFFNKYSGLARIGLVGSSQRDDLEIPTTALREALVNAIIHRDYETPDASAQPTRIDVYPDKLEISSYGELMKGVSLEDMNEDGEKVNSIRRNQIITQIFDWNQYAELNASGIARIQHELSKRDLRKPLIELAHGGHVVKITIYRRYSQRSNFDQIGDQSRFDKSPRPARRVVFISSTVSDLSDHRDAIREACERAGFEPRMMEYVLARDADTIEASLRAVNEADVYLGVFAHRYGYVPDGYEISISEMEYNRAVELGIPRLIFFIHEDHPVRARDVETGAGALKLQALKDRIGMARIASFFKSSGDLRGHVVEALTVLSRELDAAEAAVDVASVATLHRKTSMPAPPQPYIAYPYTLLQSRDLVGRQAELNALTDWVANPDSAAFAAPVFCFVAIGGMGKSALTWKWFNQIAPNEMKPLAGRLWWSFYESDADFESFVVRALCYVAGESEEAVRTLPRPEREARLLRHLNEEPYLFVLDGLERILIAYHRMDASFLADDAYDEQAASWVVGAAGLPASAAQSVAQHRPRQTTDPRAGAFLQKLARVQKKSRILITSRLYPMALEFDTGHADFGCYVHFLRGLSDRDALNLWRALRVEGSREELGPIFRSVDGHPLLVQALASEVAKYRKAPGDFAQWRADHPQFDPTSLPLVQSRTHILEFALEGLSAKVREVLNLLIGFRMGADYARLEAQLVGPDKACGSAQDLYRALTELEDRGLIGWDREANRYDAHPIVRSVVLQLADTREQVRADAGGRDQPEG